MTWILSGFADEAANSIDDQIRVIQDAGFKYMDPRLFNSDVSIVDIDEPFAKDVKVKLDAAGITANMLGTPIGKIDISEDFQTDLDRLDRLTKTAEILGCNQVRVFSYFNKTDRPVNEWRDESIKRLGTLKDKAKAAGLVLFNENELHLYGAEVAHVKDIADALRDDSFKMIFDFDNYNQAGEDVWQAWETLRDMTDAFHLKESDKDCQHVPMGEGAGRSREILADALSRGWTGCLSLEPHLAHSPAVVATGHHGQANRKLADLSPPECWQFAAGTAKKLISDIGAKFE